MFCEDFYETVDVFFVYIKLWNFTLTFGSFYVIIVQKNYFEFLCIFQTYNITYLSKYTVYAVQIACRTGAGVGPQSASQSIRTLEDGEVLFWCMLNFHKIFIFWFMSCWIVLICLELWICLLKLMLWWCADTVRWGVDYDSWYSDLDPRNGSLSNSKTMGVKVNTIPLTLVKQQISMSPGDLG